MAKVKEAKAAPKKAKTEDKTVKKRAKAAVSTTKVAGLSEERIVDSDDDEETPAAKAKVAEVQKPVKEKKEKKEKKAKADAPIPPPPTKEPSSSSSDEDSDEESDEDEEMADAPVLTKPVSVPGPVNGTKRKAESVSSSGSGESSEDESSEEDTKPDAKRVKTALKDAGEVAQVGQVATDENEDEDDDSDSGSDSHENEGPTEPAATMIPTPRRPQNSGNLGSIPVQSFKPPSGYSGVAVTNTTFSAGSFSGRQIWHIVAPRSVPLKSVEDVSLAAIQSGAAVLSYKDTEYSLIEEGNPNDQFDSVVIPSSSGYEGVSQPITKTLHVRQRVSLPKLSKKQADTNTGSSAAADISQPSVSGARPQPKGMRMRYKPAGFGAGDPGLGSDSEEDSAQAKKNGTKAQFPEALGGHGAATSADKADNAKARKSKKKRKDSDVEMVNGDVVASTPVSQSKSTSKATEARRASIADASASKDELSKEEKKRRKAEKKERRASKVAVAV